MSYATQEDVLAIFADAAKPPSGRRHFDAEAGSVAWRPESGGRDWAAYVAERVKRSADPDACMTWRGGARITVYDGRGKYKNGKRVQSKPSISIEFPRLVWLVTFTSEPPRFIYKTCGEKWCANPRHMSAKSSDQPKRKVIVMSKRGARDTRPDLSIVPPAAAGSTVPIVPVERWHRDEKHTPDSALTSIVGTLGALDADGRRRVLAAVVAFYTDAK